MAVSLWWRLMWFLLANCECKILSIQAKNSSCHRQSVKCYPTIMYSVFSIMIPNLFTKILSKDMISKLHIFSLQICAKILLPPWGCRHSNRIESTESYPAYITMKLWKQILGSSILDLAQALEQEYNTSCNIWQWMIQQAIITGNWLQGPLWIPIPSTGRSVVNRTIDRVKYYCLVGISWDYTHHVR
jgi:hypothetical protein